MAVETRSAIDLIRLLGGVVRLLTFYSDDSSSNITIKTKIGPFKKKFLLIRLIYTISLKGGQMVIVLAFIPTIRVRFGFCKIVVEEDKTNKKRPRSSH